MSFQVKPDWYVSKTFWGAIVAGIGAILSNLLLDPDISTKVDAYAAILVPFLLMALRIITKKQPTE